MRPLPQEINIKTYIGDVFPKLRYEGPYKKAVDVAEYYGFHLIPALKTTRDDRECVSHTPCPADRVTLLREYLEQGMDGWAQPVQLCHTCKIPYQPTLHFKLESVGSKKSTAEAVLIHTAYTILREYGYENVIVAINSVGGKESLARLTKELSSYFKKHLADMDPEMRQEFMGDVFAPLRSNNLAYSDMKLGAPKPISFLTEQSREHFSEVLEYLETFGIPYHIKDDLVGSEHYSARTIFEFYIKEESEDITPPPNNVLGHGERYDYLTKTIKLGRKIPAVGVTIDLNKNYDNETITEYKQKKSQEPIAYVVQVGNDARRGALEIIERLRQAQIPVALSFSEERLAHQMKHAEQLNVTALIIIGQKEISEGTVIIRNRNTHVQKVVSQNHLPSHLKRLCALY